jgi:hypothetical protein
MAAMLVFMMRPAGTGLALARRHARAVPAARDDVPMRLLPPWDGPNGITPRAETSSNARWMRFHPALSIGYWPSSDLAPTTFPPRYRILLHQPSQAKGPRCFLCTAIGRIRSPLLSASRSSPDRRWRRR